MADRSRDPDHDHIPGGTPAYREVETGKLWAEAHVHGVQWYVGTETWDLNVFTGRWSLVTPERLAGVTPSLTMDEFDAYKDIQPLEDVVDKDWRAVDAAIEDSDNRFAGLNSHGLDIFGRDGWSK